MLIECRGFHFRVYTQNILHSWFSLMRMSGQNKGSIRSHPKIGSLFLNPDLIKCFSLSIITVQCSVLLQPLAGLKHSSKRHSFKPSKVIMKTKKRNRIARHVSVFSNK